jgi:RNA polymerase sigma factor (TIGR02999 family)
MTTMSNSLPPFSNNDFGRPQTTEELFPQVYEELRRLARRHLAHEKPGLTLQPTALVHEAYFRLSGTPDEVWKSETHFFAAAAEAMRRILVETARKKQRVKHGGERHRLLLNELDIIEEHRADEILAVSDAMDRLAASSDQAAQLVKLRYFVGMSLAEAAGCLGIPNRTADRVWAYAKAFLHRELRW